MMKRSFQTIRFIEDVGKLLFLDEYNFQANVSKIWIKRWYDRGSN